MNFKDTFSLIPAFAPGALHADVADDFPDPFKLTSGEINVTRPLRLTRDRGRKPTDLVGTTLAAVSLISERTVRALREFSGWKSVPVEFLGDDGKPIGDYHCLMVTGRCGPIDKSLSVSIEKIIPTHKQGHMRVLQGLFFDPTTWDGSDVFRPPGTGHVFVLGKVKRHLEEAGLTNLHFTALSELER